MRGFISLAICLMIFPQLSFTARPLSTNDAGTVEKGAFEIEHGIEYVNGFDNETTMSLVITRGLLNNLDLGVEVPYKFIDSKEAENENGFSDISICTKLNILSAKEILPDASLNFNYKSDSANDEKGLGTGKPEYSLNAIFSKSLEQIALHLNIGYSFKEDFADEDNKDTLTYGLALEYPLNDKFNLVGEISGDTVLKRKFHDNACSALLGLNYALSDNLTLDLGAKTEISHADPDFTITCGITLGI